MGCPSYLRKFSYLAPLSHQKAISFFNLASVWLECFISICSPINPSESWSCSTNNTFRFFLKYLNWLCRETGVNEKETPWTLMLGLNWITQEWVFSSAYCHLLGVKYRGPLFMLGRHRQARRGLMHTTSNWNPAEVTLLSGSIAYWIPPSLSLWLSLSKSFCMHMIG